MYAPDQHVQRYGNLITTNSLGMRSPEPDTTIGIRILYLGDSVINGGMNTSQDNLSSKILADSLSRIFGKKVNVLNISAGSWGPDNAAAFLNTHGTFNANAMVMVFSSHDAFDNMDFEPVVGKNVHYPEHEPFSAISEVFLRYIGPWFGNVFGIDNGTGEKLMINQQRKIFNSGWMELSEIANRKHIPLLVVLHAEQNELIKGAYNRYGLRIIDTLETHHISYLKDMNWGIGPEQYRDFIHLNDEGQLFLAEHLVRPVEEILRTPASK